jgi:hypothetical protein
MVKPSRRGPMVGRLVDSSTYIALTGRLKCLGGACSLQPATL